MVTVDMDIDHDNNTNESDLSHKTSLFLQKFILFFNQKLQYVNQTEEHESIKIDLINDENDELVGHTRKSRYTFINHEKYNNDSYDVDIHMLVHLVHDMIYFDHSYPSKKISRIIPYINVPQNDIFMVRLSITVCYSNNS